MHLLDVCIQIGRERRMIYRYTYSIKYNWGWVTNLLGLGDTHTHTKRAACVLPSATQSVMSPKGKRVARVGVQRKRMDGGHIGNTALPI